jgi:hypothetical protein
MSEYQYYEFLAVDRPLTATEQAEVRELSTRARITATRFSNEYHWGDFRGDPRQMMQRYYDAHLYLANWGTHQVMLRLPSDLLSPETAGQYTVDGRVSVTASSESVILDLISVDDAGEWTEGVEDSLSAIIGVRAELAAGDLRGLYLAWLSACHEWEHSENEEATEPPVPAGLGELTGPQRALADFLRLDPDLLEVAAEASPGLPEPEEDPTGLAASITRLPGEEKDRLLILVAGDQAARARMELLRGLRGDPDEDQSSEPRRTVAELLDAAAELCLERHRRAKAAAAAQEAEREQQREAARQRRLDQLAENAETAWAQAGMLIGTRVPARYDEAVALLANLRGLAQRDGQDAEFERRFAALREKHLSKPTLIARLDRAGLTP